jgi:hypothetical protein
MDGAAAAFGDGAANCQFSVKITSAWNPLCVLLWEPDENNVAPGNPGAYDWNDGANWPSDTEGIGRLHSKKGGSLLTLSGSVQFYTREQFRQDADTALGPGPGGMSFLWWNPMTSNGRQ